MKLTFQGGTFLSSLSKKHLQTFGWLDALNCSSVWVGNCVRSCLSPFDCPDSIWQPCDLDERSGAADRKSEGQILCHFVPFFFCFFVDLAVGVWSTLSLLRWAFLPLHPELRPCHHRDSHQAPMWCYWVADAEEQLHSSPWTGMYG